MTRPPSSGGIAALLLFLAACAKDGETSLETSAAHVVDGLVFAFKAMGVVLPIAGFLLHRQRRLLGDRSSGISDPEKGPAFLYDLVYVGAGPTSRTNGLIAGFGILIIGMIAGLEGSGLLRAATDRRRWPAARPGDGRRPGHAGCDRPDGQHLVRWRHPRRVVLSDRGGWLRPGPGRRAGQRASSRSSRG